MEDEMMFRRSLVITFFSVFTSYANAQTHWLLGTWEGDLVGLRDQNTRRTLIVTSVDPSGGAATGTWAGVSVSIQIVGQTIRLFTGGNNPVELSLGASQSLEGTFTARGGAGRTYPIVMRRRA